MTRVTTTLALAGLLGTVQTATAQQWQIQPPTVLHEAAQTGPPSSAGLTPQQDRMKSCNGEASTRTLNGQARQSFMSACLSGKNSPSTMMKICNAQATQNKLTGDARSGYVSGCLKTAS